MRRVSLWVLLGIFFLAPGGFYLWAQPEAPQAIILDGFSSRSLDTSLWQIAPEKPSCLQSDGAARLTYQPGGSYSRRENITSKVPLPGRYVVQVNMVGGVQVVEMAPAPLRPAPSVLPLATGYGTPSAPAAPSLQPMAGQPGAGASYSRQPQIPTGSSPTQQIRQFAQDAVAREKRGAMTVTGHYIKPTFYAGGPQVGVSLQGQNFRFSVAFRGMGEPKPTDEPGLAVFTARGTGEQQIARIDIPAGQWVPLRLEVDGAKVVVKVKGRQPIEATLPVAPTSLQIGDLGPEGRPFSVQERVEYLIDDVRVYAGSGPDLPPDDYLAEGDWSLARQEYDNAAVEFERATVASPNEPGAKVALAYARAFSQGAGKTLPEAEQATADSPDSFLAHYYLGRFYLDMMRYDYAAKELTKALNLAPDSPSAHTWLGLALFRREARFPDEQLASDSEALGHLEAATRLLPSSAEAHQALGLCLLSARQVQRAQDELMRALELDQGLFDARLVLTSLMEPTRFSGEQTVTNTRLLVEGNPSYPPLLLALLPKEAAVAPTAVPTATPRSAGMMGPGMMGGPWMMGEPGMGGPGAMGAPWTTLPRPVATTAGAVSGAPASAAVAPPTVRPPGAVVEGFEYFRRANQWRDNGMLRPAVEEYRRWLGILVTQGKFDQVAMGAEEMTKAYRAAGLPAMEAYALYLPAEPRNTEEWPQTTAYVSQRGGEFNAAQGRAMAGALTPDQRAWLTYIKGVMQMATTSPTPGWREAIDTFKSVDEMVFWPRRGDALIHMGSCYLAIKRPYLAEQAFERALKVYQDEASRLAALGAPVASSEDRRLQTRILNCARYVNLAREQDGKLPKYDTGGVVVATAAGPEALLQLLSTVGPTTTYTTAAPGVAAPTPRNATAKGFADVLADMLGIMYNTQVGEQDRRLIALEIESAPGFRQTEKDMAKAVGFMRWSVQSLPTLPPNELETLRRQFRSQMSWSLATAPAGQVPSSTLELFRRLEAAAPPLR